MNLLKNNSDSLFIAVYTLLFISSIIPYGEYRYHVIYSLIGIFSTVVYLKENISLWHLQRIFLSIIFIFFWILVNIGDINKIYDIKDIIRFSPVMLVPLININRNDYFNKILLFIIVIAINFDFLFLYLDISQSIRDFWYLLACTIEMQGYIPNYDRHIGILGNPNSSALLYDIFILWILKYRKNQNGIFINSITIFTILEATILLIGTMSRTAIISLMICLLIGNLKIIFYMGLLIFICIIFFKNAIPIFFDNIATRFLEPTSYTSMNERIDLTNNFVAYAISNGFLMGGINAINVTDNDYVTLLLNFGIFGVAIFMVTIFSSDIIRLFSKNNYSNFNLQIIILIFLSSLAGGVIGFPSLLLISLILLRINK